MLQLQQLGLPLGFRSHVVWWEDYLINGRVANVKIFQKIIFKISQI